MTRTVQAGPSSRETDHQCPQGCFGKSIRHRRRPSPSASPPERQINVWGCLKNQFGAFFPHSAFCLRKSPKADPPPALPTFHDPALFSRNAGQKCCSSEVLRSLTFQYFSVPPGGKSNTVPDHYRRRRGVWDGTGLNGNISRGIPGPIPSAPAPARSRAELRVWSPYNDVHWRLWQQRCLMRLVHTPRSQSPQPLPLHFQEAWSPSSPPSPPPRTSLKPLRSPLPTYECPAMLFPDRCLGPLLHNMLPFESHPSACMHTSMLTLLPQTQAHTCRW